MSDFLILFLNSYTFKIVTLGCGLLGMLSALIGNFAVLKKESLLGDGISHSSLAGITLAFIIFRKKDLIFLLLGALIIGILSIFLIHLIQKYSKITFDSAIALILSSFFGLGLVLLTYLKKIPGGTKAGLNKFIFGQASTLIVKDIYLLISIGSILLIIILLFWKEIKISIFDKDYAMTLGINSQKISFLISSLIVINVIIGIQIAGVILITAMMVSPAVSARLWSDKLYVVIILSSIFGLISGIIGSILSSLNTNLPTGPLIIIILSLIMFFSILFSPKKGIISRYYFNRKRNLKYKKSGE